MAILPIQLARVSNNMRSELVRRTITQAQQGLLNVQNELATGKRLNTPSDNPADAAIAQQLRKLLEQRQGYSANLSSASSHLSEVDSTLSELTDLLRQAQSIASANVGSIVSADERSAAATAVNALYNQALVAGNRQFQGMYLFAGDRSGQPPFIPENGGIRFNGSESLLENRYDAGTLLPFMVSGADVFAALSTRVKGTADLTPDLTSTTRLSDLRGATGDGVRTGSILLGNGSASALVDLSGASSVGDVVDAINAAAVGGITASIAADGQGILLSAGALDDITVADVGGTTASDLGILRTTGAGAGAPLDGSHLSPILAPFTKLADLSAGAGIDTSGLIITIGSASATIDLASATTVEDLVNAINGSGIGAFARINAAGNGIDVLNAIQGAPMIIAENGGTTATDLGIRSFSAASPLTELNNGVGIRTVAGADIQVTRRDGTTFQVDLDGLATVQVVLDAINTADAGGGVTASFAASGNGIVLTDTTGGGGTLSVSAMNYSLAAQDLGLNVAAAGNTLTGRDVNAVAAEGLLANLANLRDALLHNDTNAITTSAEGLQEDLARVVRFRGQVGAQVKDFESRLDRLEDQKVATQAALSTLEDTDYNEAVTRFQSLQTALQANLQTAGKLLSLSLLDFLG